MDLLSYLPTLVDYSPINTCSSLSPEIYCKFNVKLHNDVFSTAGVNRYFSLFNEVTKEQIYLTFMRSELDGKAVRFYPSGSLATSTRYTLSISAELPSSQNRQCDTGNLFSFTTTSSVIKSCTLLAPGYEAITSTPDMAWSVPEVSGSLSGSLVYELQICSNERFVALGAGEFSFGPSGYTVSGNTYYADLEPTHNYFWRVRGISLSGSTAVATGDWSGVGKFYLGSDTYTETHDFTLMTLVPDTVTFGAVKSTEIISVNGDSNVPTWPDLSIATALDVDMALSCRSIDGYPNGYWTDVDGSIVTLSGGYLFEPYSNIRPNHLYKLEISLSGNVTHCLTFSSRYTPLYSSVEVIRSQIGGYVDAMSDDEIYLNIFRVSLTANRHYYIYSPGMAPYSAPLEDVIRNLVVRIPYAMGLWVEKETCARVLRSRAMSMLYEFGHTSQLADFKEDNDVALLREINKMADKFRTEAEIWLAEFSKKRIPLLAVPVGDWSNNQKDFRSKSHIGYVPRDWR